MFEWFGYIVFAVASIILISLIDHEEWGWSSVFLIGTFALVHFFLPMYSIVNWFYNDPWGLAGKVGIYISIGIVWSFIKWYFYLLRQRDAYIAKRERVIRGNTIIAAENEQRARAKQTLRTLEDIPEPEIPLAANNKARITAWMGYWPWSAVWTLIDDPIRRFYDWLLRVFSSLYDLISKSMYSKYKA